jgi:5,10-methylenetetrahydrofolate reductase
MSLLEESLKQGKFVATGEVGPPKGINIAPILEEAKHCLKGRVVAVNVTDNQSSVMRVGSLAICQKLLEVGVEPIFQMTCRDRNRLALQSDLLSAAVSGIENVLCLTGDHIILGDHPQAKPVFDLDSVTLLKTVSTLQTGKDLSGGNLDGTPKFFRGAVVAPAAVPLEPQIIKMESKIEAGAQFFQTQAVFDAKIFESFAKQTEKFKVPVLLGIILLKSAAMAKFMNENVAGVSVPDSLVKEMAETKKEDRQKKSVEIASRLIRQMKPLCQGVHLMPLGWGHLVPELLSAATL